MNGRCGQLNVSFFSDKSSIRSHITERTRMNKVRILEMFIAIVLGGFIATVTQAFGSPTDLVPELRVIPYEGYLEQDGTPVSGTLNMVFGLYTAAEAGELIWQSSSVPVDFHQGEFMVELGSAATSRLPERVFSERAVYVEIQIDSTRMEGRQRLMNPWLAVNGPVFIQTGELTVDGPSTLRGNTSVTGTLSTTGRVTSGGGLTVTGTTALNGNTTVAGALATTGTTGRITSSGGLTVNGTTTLNGNSSVTGTLGTSGRITSSGGLTVNGGSTTLNGSLAVTGGITSIVSARYTTTSSRRYDPPGGPDRGFCAMSHSPKNHNCEIDRDTTGYNLRATEGGECEFMCMRW
jgi:hypothetical protein